MRNSMDLSQEDKDRPEPCLRKACRRIVLDLVGIALPVIQISVEV